MEGSENNYITDSRLFVLHDHYRDSFKQLRKNSRYRNMLMIFIIAIAVLLYLDSKISKQIGGAVLSDSTIVLQPEKPTVLTDLSAMIKNKAKINLENNFAMMPKLEAAVEQSRSEVWLAQLEELIKPLAWIFLLGLLISFFQKSLLASAQLNYVKIIEHNLTQVLGGKWIALESEGVARSQYKTFCLGKKLYNHFFLFFVFFFAARALYIDLAGAKIFTLSNVIGIVVFFTMLFSSFLYLFDLNRACAANFMPGQIPEDKQGAKKFLNTVVARYLCSPYQALPVWGSMIRLWFRTRFLMTQPINIDYKEKKIVLGKTEREQPTTEEHQSG